MSDTPREAGYDDARKPHRAALWAEYDEDGRLLAIWMPVGMATPDPAGSDSRDCGAVTWSER